jgi:hypothetical protein
MKKSKLLPILLAAIVIGATGCKAGTEQQTTTPLESQTLGTARERQGDDAFAIDKINVDPLPEGAVYTRKLQNALDILMPYKWDCTISALNYRDQFSTLEDYADKLMANYVLTYKAMFTEVVWEDPVKTKVGEYDAILYNFVIEQILWETVASDVPATDAQGSQISYVGKTINGRAYFFLSGTDAYYMIFTCQPQDFDEASAQWDEILANVKVDEDLKISEVTTVSALTTITETTT